MLSTIFLEGESILSDINTSLLVDQAYQAIKEDVLHKRLIPGKKINVSMVSKRYSISPTPIKLALNRLVSEGVVESIPHRGMVIRPISKKDLVEIIEVRQLLELFCVPAILKKAKEDPSFLLEMESNLHKHKEAIQIADEQSFYFDQNSIDAAFHHMLMETAHNDRLLSMYSSLGSHLTMFYLYGVKRKARFEASLQEHHRIFEAIQSGDADRLSAAISLHLQNTQADYLLNIESMSQPPEKEQD